MPMYSPAQSDQAVDTNLEDRVKREASLELNAANPTATKWVYVLTFFVLAALIILCVVGPHVPAGE